MSEADSLPTIEVIVKLAIAFGVFVDYLLGEGLNAAFHKEILNDRMNWEVSSVIKKRIFDYMDLIIRNFNAKAGYNDK